ncbi:MAG TPA: LamG-like jellyroll fold domain-containing protein [Candidatus Nitrosocosmicus sp.]|nr:LamG-like jellyroll fold domain-containing protein [Candidatus Nitrosocosmicus sp.]
MEKIKKLLALVLIVTLAVLPCAVVQAGGGGDQKLAVYYKFDGDFTDASGNGNNGTQIGDISFVDSINGKGARFEGGYIEVNHKDVLNLEKGFTFSVWIYTEHTKEQMMQPIIVKTDVEKKVGTDAYFFKNEQDRPHLGVWTNGFKLEASKQWVDIQKWSLCTVTADSENVRFYIDGKLQDSVAKKVTFPKSTGKLYIGYKNTPFGSHFFKGIMDDLKIFNYAMTPAEVQNEFNVIASGSGKNLVNRPLGMVAFYRFEGGLEDMSGYGNNGTPVSAKGGLTYVDGIAGKALLWDGASYIEVNDSDSLDMDNGFTCSVWLKLDERKNTGVDYQPIVDKRDGDSFLWKGRSAYLVKLGFDDKAVLELHRGGKDKGTGENGGFAALRPANKWYMLTITASGADMKLYLDGVLKQTVAKSNYIPHSLGSLLIGIIRNVNNVTSYFKGTMDELRLYNYELTPVEVQALYALQDRLKVTAAKTTLAKNETVQLLTELEAYKFTSPTPEANTGTNKIVIAKGIDSFAATDVTAAAQYTSSNAKVVTASASGAVKAIAKGKATITVTYEDMTVVKEFTVN